PKKNDKVPHKPKKCMGRLPNLPTNMMDARSRNPFTKRSHPNLVTPYLRARCSTTFSPIFLKPDHLASMGIYRCISPYISMLFTTFFLYAFKPQLKSCSFIPELFLAAALNNFDGRFFVNVLSYRFFFHPLTMSKPSSVIMRYSSGTSSGL